MLDPSTVNGLGLKWTYATGDLVCGSPTVVNGVLYIGSWDHKIYALNADTGSKLWSYATPDRVCSQPAVVGGVVYVGSYGATFLALDAGSGAKLWSYIAGDSVFGASVANGVVYVGSFDHNVYALDASSGERLWKVVSRKLWKSEYRISPELSHGVSFRPCFVPSS